MRTIAQLASALEQLGVAGILTLAAASDRHVQSEPQAPRRGYRRAAASGRGSCRRPRPAKLATATQQNSSPHATSMTLWRCTRLATAYVTASATADRRCGPR